MGAEIRPGEALLQILHFERNFSAQVSSFLLAIFRLELTLGNWFNWMFFAYDRLGRESPNCSSYSRHSVSSYHWRTLSPTPNNRETGIKLSCKNKVAIFVWQGFISVMIPWAFQSTIFIGLNRPSPRKQTHKNNYSSLLVNHRFLVVPGKEITAQWSLTSLWRRLRWQVTLANLSRNTYGNLLPQFTQDFPC